MYQNKQVLHFSNQQIPFLPWPTSVLDMGWQPQMLLFPSDTDEQVFAPCRKSCFSSSLLTLSLHHLVQSTYLFKALNPKCLLKSVQLSVLYFPLFYRLLHRGGKVITSNLHVMEIAGFSHI